MFSVVVTSFALTAVAGGVAKISLLAIIPFMRALMFTSPDDGFA